MKIDGLPMEFELELDLVRFVNAVQFSTQGSSLSCGKTPQVRVYADFDSELVLLHHTQKGEKVLVPFTNCASMRPAKAEVAKVEAPPPARPLSALVEKAMAHASAVSVPSDPELDDVFGPLISKRAPPPREPDEPETEDLPHPHAKGDASKKGKAKR